MNKKEYQRPEINCASIMPAFQLMTGSGDFQADTTSTSFFDDDEEGGSRRGGGWADED